ncbi:MAG: metal ABC transporter substrate-binding protein [Alicyclobacillaceae bacterium]|nr:metal ABC transporter substrate-binding protein [Alicyclobacillaceae bacterium]
MWCWALALIAALAGCGRAAPTGNAGAEGGSGDKVAVVTSITPLADMIRQVGGDRVAVTALVAPGTDPHDFAPKPSDIRAVAGAKVFIANGLGEETYLEKLIQSSGRSDLKVVVLSDGLQALGGGEEGQNPHMWLAPSYAIRYVEKIRDTLAQVDPAGATGYQERAKAYIDRLRELDAWIREQIAQIPPDRRTMVVFHDAWPYFCREYGLDYIYLVSSEQAEPSAQEYAKILTAVKERRVPAVFGEEGFNPKLVQRLAADAGVRFVDGLLDDTVGGAGADTYIDMMKFDVQLIVGALSGR